MDWRSLPIVAFDTETTGLNPDEGHRVIEFAGVEFRVDPEGAIRSVKRHEWLFDPGLPIPREVTEVNHITDDDVRGKPKFEERGAQIHALLSKAVTVAHNYPFDQRFLTAEFARMGLKWPSPPAEVDTSDLSRVFQKEAKSHRLGELAQRMEVPLVEAHRAGNDAEACGRVFLAMSERYHAPADLVGMIEWADAVGEPPTTGHIVRDPTGVLVFGDGPHQGRPIEEKPDFLHGMSFARLRAEGAWGWRYPEAVRRWADRYLRIRASGRFPQGMKGFGAGDWGIDPPLGAGDRLP